MILDVALISTSLIVYFFIIYIYTKKNIWENKLYRSLFLLFISIFIQIFGVTLQSLLGSRLNIDLVYYEYISYLGGVFMPVFLLILAIRFNNEKAKLKYKLMLFIIPVISLIILWTNDFHHLFYIEYSTMISETKFGAFFNIYSMYSYICMFVSVILFMITSLKKSGFLSIQVMLVVIGTMFPLVPNILATFKIISMSVHITPIMLSLATICFAIAIIKYKALNITPVAFRTVMDTMSDSYIVISNDGTIVSTNKTFDDSFSSIMDFDKNKNFFEILKDTKLVDLKELKKDISLSRRNGKIIKKEYHLCFKDFDKYFEVDIHPIAAKSDSKEYVGTLLLFKDITQHMLDMEALKEKQEIIVKQGQLVSIGELAGGVAHDINTPISAIKTGIVMLRDMKKDVPEAEKEILNRMDSCATKIINIVNSMRNQIRNLGSDVNIKFKVSEVINDIKIITYHEFAKNKTTLNINIKKDVSVIGDPTKLGQVFTNLTVNAVQAYKEKKNNVVEVTVDEENKETVLITVKDYAGGIDEKIVPFVFKNILTTKGTNGTGLGLYLVYSIVKGEFNGDITFDTKVGEGTTFYIRLPKA